MHLSFEEAWAGTRRKAAACPRCGSETVRYSRRTYDGWWGQVFKVLPLKCSACGFYFPVARDASIPQADDLAELKIPFRPVEFEEAHDRVRGDAQASDVAKRGGCPKCGSRDIRSSRPPTDRSPLLRLEVQDAYRCLDCNASFRRTNRVRLTVVTLALASIFGGLSYLILQSAGRGASKAPKAKKGQVPPPPPPVFR